jgi:prepilin-type N-terminal cleavage/methylation domain-containing protein
MPAVTRARSERGFTLVELLVAMSIGTIVVMVAFGLVRITGSNVRRADEEVTVDQTARSSFQRVMDVLHSGCIRPEATPVKEKSTESTIRVVSETGQEAELPRERLHEIIYSSTAHTITEKIYTSEGGLASEKWPATPKVTLLLASHIEQAVNSGGKKQPIFSYYRYYAENPETHEYAHPGELEPTSLAGASTSSGLSKEEAQEVAKVTVQFTVAPNLNNVKALEGTQLEDSAIYRMTPASTIAEAHNEPCS